MLKIRLIGQAVQKLSGKENETLGCCDLALDPVTFTSELDLGMVGTTCMLEIKSIGQAVQKLSSGKNETNFWLL